MKHILVAGGAGFLGRHLCQRLLDAGHHVTCLDNFASSDPAHLGQLLAQRHFKLIRHDICVPRYLEVDEIYNLACPASPPRYQADPIQTTKTSVLGVLHLLELARHTGARFLQASTSEIYGDPIHHPQAEEHWGHVNPVGVRSCYDEGKRLAESLCYDFQRQHQVEIRVARIFNTYGPGMDKGDGRVVSNFITQALRHQPITLYGDGSQTRSFCYVADLIDGLIRLMQSAETRPVNLGNPAEITVLQLARQVVRLTQSRSDILLTPLPADDPARRRPDISRARALLGWAPEVGLAEGLEPTIAWFRQQLARGYPSMEKAQHEAAGGSMPRARRLRY